MIRVIESKRIKPEKDIPEGETCLYIRRDMSPDNKSYKEYSYICSHAEAEALGIRCRDVDLDKVDVLLRAGKSFDEALKELGK